MQQPVQHRPSAVGNEPKRNARRSCMITQRLGAEEGDTPVEQQPAAMRDFDPTYDRCGSDSVIRRRRLNVRFAGKRTRLKRFASTPPNKRDRSSLAVGRDPESEPLAASRRSPIPATVSIAEEARGRRGPRRGRSSALARSIDLDQPKKEGPGGGSIFGRVPQDRVRARPRFFEFATESRALSRKSSVPIP